MIRSVLTPLISHRFLTDSRYREGIDVRTPEEFSEGHIPGAINIDVKGEGFDEKVAQLDKSQPVAIYCRSGRRSKLAAERMANAGFKVTELSEGILSWKGEVVK